eukprot:scaffold66282_cov61-Phaeocystis_antarctica.AAC.3
MPLVNVAFAAAPIAAATVAQPAAAVALALAAAAHGSDLPRAPLPPDRRQRQLAAQRCRMVDQPARPERGAVLDPRPTRGDGPQPGRRQQDSPRAVLARARRHAGGAAPAVEAEQQSRDRCAGGGSGGVRGATRPRCSMAAPTSTGGTPWAPGATTEARCPAQGLLSA